MKPFHLLKILLGTLAISFVMTGTAQAAAQGTPAEAEAMIKKAAAYIKTNGPEKAYDEITNGKMFKDRDLYIFAYDMNGKNLAHGANPKLVGKNLIGLKDPAGNLVITPLIAVAQTKGEGWSEPFKFRNPVTEKMEDKVAYIKRIGDTLIGCGVYKK